MFNGEFNTWVFRYRTLASVSFVIAYNWIMNPIHTLRSHLVLMAFALSTTYGYYLIEMVHCGTWYSWYRLLLCLQMKSCGIARFSCDSTAFFY